MTRLATHFPSRTSRDAPIADLREGRSATIAGRFSVETNALTDASGSVEVSNLDPLPPGGVVLECTGRLTGGTFHADACTILTPTQAPVPGIDHTTLRFRARALAAARTWFADRGFLEVETPLLVRAPGMEPHLVAFPTRSTADADRRLYLPTSPEYAMKRLLVSGCNRIYQICKAFRDEPAGRMHAPEFTMLEWYRSFADFRTIADDTEHLVSDLARSLTGRTRITRNGAEIDLAPPWQRLTVTEAFRHYAGIAADPCENPEAFLSESRSLSGSGVSADDDFDSAFFKLFLDRIEPKLGVETPVILTHYPASMGALARTSEANPHVAERFEVYISGVELANAFTELTDPVEQRERLEAEQQEREHLGHPTYDIDERFLAALLAGMPPSGGIALGFDRLLMLLAGKQSINETVSFPYPEL